MEEYRGYGTLGGMVIDHATGAKMILSNWHVLVGFWRRSLVGPSTSLARAMAALTPTRSLRFLATPMAANLDAAVAKLDWPRARSINDQFELSPVKGVGWAGPGWR